MSVLEKIRSKTGLLVGIVGLALVIFILESLLGSGGALFSGQDLEVGKINGDQIDYPAFSAKVNEQIAQIQQSNPNQVIDDKMKEQIIESVWSQMINDKVIKVQYKKLCFFFIQLKRHILLKKDFHYFDINIECKKMLIMLDDDDYISYVLFNLNRPTNRKRNTL